MRPCVAAPRAVASHTAQRIAAAARGAVGARFRVHGRDPAYGLDCVGLAALALKAGGCRGAEPHGYAMRGGSATRFAAMIAAAGLRAVDHAASGDLLLFDSGPGQFHLAIAVEGGVVHADAALRRVVERPGASGQFGAPWRLIGAWRLED